MNIKQAYNFKEIDEMTTCSGMLKDVSLKSLADEGYGAVINLLPDDSEYAVEEERAGLEELGIRYKYIPVVWEEPQRSDFESFESAMNATQGTKTHIHCAANFRVTAFYGIYAFRNHGWSEAKLREFVGSIWQLSEHPAWDKFVAGYVGA